MQSSRSYGARPTRAGPALLLAFALGGSAAEAAEGVAADAAQQQLVQKLMQDVYRRDDGDLAHTRLRMLIKRDNRTRERTLSMWWRRFGGGSRRLLIFEAPGDIQNSGLLSVDYDEPEREDDQWLFLKSLHRSTRITTDTKSGSFMGSDFSFADLTKPNPASYTFSLVAASEDVSGEDCTVVDAVPDARTKKESGYSKVRYWVSKQKHMFVRAKLWVESTHKLKFIQFGDVRQVSGIWTAYQVTARTLQGSELESETTVSTMAVAYGQTDVNDEMFTVGRLERGL
ncbi:MAG: outer membrane lipoprotein-sorting protein [Deltaproteobacteria bacterium]